MIKFHKTKTNPAVNLEDERDEYIRDLPHTD